MSDRPDGDQRHHVVIVGAGFGGLFCAKALRRVPVRVTLVDRTNHHLFQPLLYQVATGILSEGQIAPATRDIFRHYPSMRIILGEVTDIDAESRVVAVTELDHRVDVAYDSLVIAGGAASSYFGHDEFATFASGMKTLDDALSLRGQIFGAFERAEAELDEAERRRLMTFVVVGGGPTGVEMAGQLKELARRALHRNYRRIDPTMTRVVLVEGGDALVATMGPRLSKMTQRDLTKLGIEVHLGAMVTAMDANCVQVTTADGTRHEIEAATKIWAAGTVASPLASHIAERTGATLNRRGQVEVNVDCSVPGHEEIFVVGDMMALDDLPGVAEVAMQSGVHAAHCIEHRLDGDLGTRPFRYRDLGTLAASRAFGRWPRSDRCASGASLGGCCGWWSMSPS